MELFARDGSSETGLVLPHVFKGYYIETEIIVTKLFSIFALAIALLITIFNKSLYLHLHLIRIYLFVNALLDRLKSRKGFHKIA